MKTKRIQLRVPETWLPLIQQAALRAGYSDVEDQTRGTTNSASNWLRSLIAAEIGVKEPMDYHQWKEQFAQCVYGELESFREIFTRYVDPDTSPLHRATYDLGCFLQDVPKGPSWDDGLEPDEPSRIEHEGGFRAKEQIHEILLRAVMHSVNYLAFGDIRLGGGTPPREKASNLYPVLASHDRNRGKEKKPFSWVNRALYAGQSLCSALKLEGIKRDQKAQDCSDLIVRARHFLEPHPV